MTRHKHSKKQILKFFTQYGVHIWAILLIANAVMVYTYHIASHAAGKNDTTVAVISGTPSPSLAVSGSPSGAPSIAQVSPSAAPVGPTINLTFTVPGIGSGGGVMKPVHTKRNVTVYLYAPDVNSMDPTVNPLYTIQGSAVYDNNSASPTYTSFINPSFDLGSSVTDGEYQVAFRTDLSFTTLVKASPTDLGGEVFSLNSGGVPVILPSQPVLMGDSIPSGNNYSFTINDYNAFINCYGDKNTTNSFCIGKNYADFNDDGIVDGIDYNILIRSLGGLVQQGQTLPTITPAIIKPSKSPRPTSSVKPTAPHSKTTPTASASSKPTSSKGGGGAGIIVFLLLLIILGGVGAFLYFKNPSVHALINSLIHLSPTGTPEAAPSPTASEEAPAEEVATETETQSSTLKETKEPDKTPETPKVAQPVAPAPVASAAPQAAGEEEKDCYIKTKGPDEAGTGMWILLTDDNGAVNAHYSKKDVKDGFAKVKGVMKTENGKTFMEVTSIAPED
ncbi:MAG TPA: hypothetical protein VLF93_05795 [Candidatus Saccharimonadales bacterium]|nr:hypothetical protein [Candidatus Saccharimonadales bacterium]